MGKPRRPVDANHRPKKRKQAGSVKSSVETKQTSLLSFWGKNKTIPKKPPETTSGIPNESPAQNTHTSLDLQSKDEACRHKSTASAQYEAIVETPSNSILCENESQTSATITPCKPLASENDTNDGESTTLERQNSELENMKPESRPRPSLPGTANESLSEYEKLRLRNIERNNARLAALGLLNQTPTAGKHKNRTRPPRKKAKAYDRVPQQPLRRSSRNRKPVSEQGIIGSLNFTKNTDEEISGPNHESSIVTIEEEESYTTSPLLEYEMNHVADKSMVTSLSKGPIHDSKSNVSCLAVTGPRFLPPKGLTAIYSLEFLETTEDRSHWLVGAGKAGMIAVWNTKEGNARKSPTSASESFVHPVLSWKAHSGRWIADAKFLLGAVGERISRVQSTPSRLLTAGNDGTVCLWDLSKVSSSAGTPRLEHRTGKDYHNSGIFSMDTISSSSNGDNPDVVICTGSKDKSIVVSSVSTLSRESLWRSRYHSAKVGCVNLQSHTTSLLASASDDGIVAIHDYRMNGSSTSSSSIVAELEDAHNRPHSVVWDRNNESILATAGLDPVVKVWDFRNLSKPMVSLEGHVPTSSLSRIKRIHRPTFFDPSLQRSAKIGQNFCPFLLTGGQGSSYVSMYQLGYQREKDSSILHFSSLYSRGKLPLDCGDSGSMAVSGGQVAVAVDQGEVILLEATGFQ